ncbi:MAG: hypothetical protein Kow00121_35910 [Elainellaceae cyanobacterium]
MSQAIHQPRFMGKRRQDRRRKRHIKLASALYPALLTYALKRSLLVAISGLSIAALIGGVLLPQVVQAYTSEGDVTLQWREGETYAGLVRRAEIAARATAQQYFDRDILITDVDVTVLVEGSRSVIPVLVLKVSRDDWRQRPDPRYWATYFSGSRELLELNTPASNGDSSSP